METKTFVVGDSNQSANNVISALAPLLQQRGIDPSVLAMMNNGGMNGWGGGFIWVLFLLAMFGWGGNAWGNGGFGNNNGAGFLANQINNSEGRDLLMQAIQGNKDAIAALSTTLNTDFQTVNSAIQGINTQLCGIGKDIGMTGMQVINALQQGNMTLAQQISNGFSQVNLSMCQQTNALQGAICDAKTDIKNGLTMLGFQGERQTNTLTQAINASTQRIVDGQTAAEQREMQAVITRQAAEIAQLQATANLAPITTQLAQLQAAVAALTPAARTTTAG